MSYAVAIPPTRHRATKVVLDRAPTANPVPAVVTLPNTAAIFDPFGNPCSAAPAVIRLNGAAHGGTTTQIGNVLTFAAYTHSKSAAPRVVNSLALQLTKNDGGDVANGAVITSLLKNGVAFPGYSVTGSGAVTLTPWSHTRTGVAPRIIDSTHLQLTNGDGVDLAAATLSSLYRTDWQGRVALSDSPRTNKITNSANFSGWGISNASLGTGAANPKDGGASTRLIRGASTLAESALQALSGGVITAGSPLFEGVFAKAGTGKYLYLRIIYADANLPSGLVQFDLSTGTVAYIGSTFTGKASIRAASNGWYFCTINGTATALPPANRIDIGCADNLGLVTGSVGTYVDIYGGSLTDADGPYIATATTPVTLTDLSQSGGTITLAQSGGTYDGSWSYNGGIESGESFTGSWTYTGGLEAGDSVSVDW